MLECKSSLAEAIIAIVDKRGIEIVNSPGIFCAIIDDIIPDLDKERKIIRRVFDEEVAKYIVDAYFSEKNQRNIILKRLNLYLENSLGVSEEWRSIFLDAFSIAFAWDYVTKTKESNSERESFKNNVEKEIDFSRYIPNIIAVGSSHTVGLMKDGTVLAVGNNKSGECNVEKWENVVAVSARGALTVGLLKDGTLIQTGTVSLGVKADISDIKYWNKMVEVSAGAINIVGLRNNGKPFGCGANQNGQCDVLPWNNIMAVATGHGHALKDA